MPREFALNGREQTDDMSDDYLRARAVRSCEALLERLVKYHAEHCPSAVSEFYARQREKTPPPEVESVPELSAEEIDAQKMCEWVQRQKELHPDLREWNTTIDGGPTIGAIHKRVCKEFGISQTQLISHRRTKNLIPARQAAAYLSRELTVFSFPEIGRRLGGRDHTTILHAVKEAERKIVTDPAYAARVGAIKASFKAAAE